MTNTNQVPDLEGLHLEIHDMAEQMRIMNENNGRLMQLLTIANPPLPAAPPVPDIERSRHSFRSGDRSQNVSIERVRGRRRAPSPSSRGGSFSESSKTLARARRGRSPHRGDHTETRNKSTSRKIRDLDAQIDAINTGTNAPVTVDTLIRQTEPPFTKRVLRARISSKFKLPAQLGIYEGKTDPMDHLDSYKSLMLLQGCSDEVMCKAFSATLKGPARSWFRKLSPGTIDSFGDLGRLFVANFMSCRNRQKNASHLFTVHQKETESLKDFVKRFNQAILEVEDPSDKVIIMAMMEGLRPGPLFDSLSKNVPETLSALQSKADKEETRYKRPDRDPKRSNDRRPRTPPRRPEFILPPLNAPVAQVLSKIKHEEFVKWPGKIKTDPQKRNRNKYCEFHLDHGHNTEDCFQLKEQIDDLIKRGYLRKYVVTRPSPNSPDRRYGDNRPTAGDIQTIHGGFGSGGCSTSSRKKHTRSALRLAEEEIYNLSSSYVGDQIPITFSNDDLRGLHLPHDDALVVSAVIANFNVQRIVIDNGSSADILFISAFERMKIGQDKLHSFHTPLIGFGGNMTHPLGWINLPITLGTEPHQTTIWQDFIVVDCPSPYNAILGPPTLGGIKAIASAYHLKNIGDDIGVMRDEVEQLTLADPRETDNTKSLEEVVPISIHPDHPDRHIMIGTELTDELRSTLINFLKKNSDIFAWSQGDVPSIDPEIAMHKLFTNPKYSPVRQKRRKFAPERLKVIKDEVSKLIRANVVQEVYYPDWLANVVVALKKRGKWRIKMYPPDIEKTSFITEQGLYCYKVMPFGLKNAGATYQRLVNKMFKEQIEKTMEVYIDDMLVKSLRSSDHIAHLEEAFSILRHHRMMLNPSKCIFGVSSGKFLGFLVTKRGIEVNPDQIQALIAMNSPRNVREVQQLTRRVAALNRFVSKSTNKSISGLRLYSQSLPPAKIFNIFIYLAYRQARYLRIEKLAYALMIAARKLRHYFQAHPIIILTDQPLKQILQRPDTSGRLLKWFIELSEFHIEYRPRMAIKAQALADFIVKSTHEGTPQPEIVHPENEISKEPTPEKDLAHWILFVDGSSNQHGCGAGLVIQTPSGEQMEYAIRIGFKATNNEAEYEALLAGLRIAVELGAQSLEIFSDSQLVVNQVQGDYLAKDARMMAYLGEVKATFAKIKEFKIHQIPREDNKKADALANLASTFEFISDRCIPLEFLASPSIEIANQILQTEESPTWMDEIIAYLQKGTLLKDKLQARRLQYRSARFCIFKGRLYKRSFSGPFLKCLRPEEAKYVLKEIHEGICGNHSGARSLARKTIRQGYFWPTIERDVATYIRRCDKCQRFAPVSRHPHTEMVIISDNARQFDNDKYRLFCSDLAISHHFSSPGHPQANGQVEVTNRTILRNLKARLERSKKRMRQRTCRSILWAYHTTSRIPTGETPYSIVFGTESVIPVKIGMPSFRTSNFDKENNEAELRLNLDLLEERREKDELRQAAYKCQVTKYYNRRVKHRSFLPGDPVLRKVTLSIREPNTGKLDPTWEGPYKVIKVSKPETYWLEDPNGKALLHPWNAEHLKKYYQ
ncbi:hypothetical protein Acr_00g0069450 [Actinidia rufa]|uniref:Uncharacterized protein n=1 Tax=Actinidia rufa TaxID=165716 RepID=A0A7J0DSS3_9ERIC|nr:hypothetical protein Acr_00g0069450 [Actinidia rufa]